MSSRQPKKMNNNDKWFDEEKKRKKLIEKPVQPKTLKPRKPEPMTSLW